MDARRLMGCLHYPDVVNLIRSGLAVNPARVTDEDYQYVLVTPAGLELFTPTEPMQVIDSTKQQKRQKRSFRRIEVHCGYTE